MKIYKRLFEIESKGYKTVFGKLFQNYQKNMNTKNMTSIKNNMIGIAQENLLMYKRLRDKQSSYDVNQLLKDYYKNQYYKQNACRYQSIDFLKDTKKLSNKTKIKRINNIKAFKTENNYFPKISKKIITKFNSNYNNNFYKINNCEGYRTLTHKKIIGKKKKFKDFNFNPKDLKKLKEKKLNLIYKIFNKDENSDKGKKKDINNEENINDSYKLNNEEKEKKSKKKTNSNIEKEVENNSEGNSSLNGDCAESDNEEEDEESDSDDDAQHKEE